MKGGQRMPVLSLPKPFLIRKKVPVLSWVNKESFPVVAWRSQPSNSQPHGDVLHHNRAALTTRPRRLSIYDEYSILFISLSCFTCSMEPPPSYDEIVVGPGQPLQQYFVEGGGKPSYVNTVELQWLENRWLIYHGYFELVLESIGNNPIAAYHIWDNLG